MDRTPWFGDLTPFHPGVAKGRTVSVRAHRRATQSVWLPQNPELQTAGVVSDARRYF